MKNVSSGWRLELKHNLKPADIMKRLGSTATAKGLTQEGIMRIDDAYSVAITRHYSHLIDWQNPDDPLLRTVLPSLSELDPRGLEDQSGESLNIQKTGIRGLQHKYPSTALLMITGKCAAYCRYCFRRRFVGTESEAADDLEKAFRYIESHREINNVLISGGDAFMAGDRVIAKVLARLREIDHVGIIRLGTKMPVYLPSRFDDQGLLELLKKHNLPDKRIYVSSHVDHPAELSPEAIEAHRRLIEAGIQVRSQTVLVAGINDSPGILSALLRRLSEIGVTPYYVFQCRPAKGAIHYALPLLDASGVMKEANKELGGLAKTARLIMSHVSGKIEVVSVEAEGTERIATLRYHSARDERFNDRIMVVRYNRIAFWLDDILRQRHEALVGGDALEFAKEQAELL